MPRISEIVGNIAKYKYFSQVDLKNAYHQVPLVEEERQFTAFEADGQLFEFTRIPFGVTNGVACFQRVLDDLIRENDLKDTYGYVDDVTICGRTQAEHDFNLKRFLDAAKRSNLTLNFEKSVFSTESVCVLGHLIENGTIRPDPRRLKPLLNMPAPTDSKAMKRTLGMLAYYSKWIPNFSDRLQILVQSKEFPLAPAALQALKAMKESIATAATYAIDDNEQFSVETDESGFALAATLSQNGRPVAFFTRSLAQSERNQHSVEKEASAIVEAVRYWRQFLIGKKFKLVTDQRSVAFIFDTHHQKKIKNEKIARWKLDLSPFVYDIEYRPGSLNASADALSRAPCELAASVQQLSLNQLHEHLAHPGITRLRHFVRIKNLPFSSDEVRNVVNNCRTCAKIKPQYCRYKGTLINSTRPLQRVSLDFKGPLPSSSRNRYLLTLVDEYSRFPWAFAVPDQTAETVIRCLSSLFYLFGMPESLHCDGPRPSFRKNCVTFFWEEALP